MTRDEAIAKVQQLASISDDPFATATERLNAGNVINQLRLTHDLQLADFDAPGEVSLVEIAPFLERIDDGWTGTGWRPSELYQIGVSAARAFHGVEQVARFQRQMIDKARMRWRQGFWPDPFTKTPRLRSAVEQTKRAA